MQYQYLVIEGPIGAGKTTVARKLGHIYGAHTALDRPADNPFLEDFYRGVPQAAFKSQLHFLAQRVLDLRGLTRVFPADRPVVSDFLLEKDRLFANLNLDDQELKVYSLLYEAVCAPLASPDLVVYLKAPLDTLMARIRNRAWAMESHLSTAYLVNVMEAYEHFFFQYQQRTRLPVLVVDSARANFATDGPDLHALADFIRGNRVVGLQYYSPKGGG